MRQRILCDIHNCNRTKTQNIFFMPAYLVTQAPKVAMGRLPCGLGAVRGPAGAPPVSQIRHGPRLGMGASYCLPSLVGNQFVKLNRSVPHVHRARAQPIDFPGLSLPILDRSVQEDPFTAQRAPQQMDSLNAEPQSQDSWPSHTAQFIGGPLTGMRRRGPSLPRRRRNRDGVLEAAAAADAGANKKLLGLKMSVWSKIIPLGLMFFCILFNYTILRDTKDVLVVTAPGSGAEIIPFLKTWVNLPMAIGFTILYSQLANVLSSEMLFYACILPFIMFFASFAFILYPLRDLLHPTAFAQSLLEFAGPRFAGPIAILRNWTFCLFYVMAELWGSVVVSVLFWGFANQITSIDEATRFYPLFGLGANVALIFSGRAVKYFSKVRASLPPGVDGWGISLKGLMAMVVIGGLIITGIYYWMCRAVVPTVPKRAAKKKKKAKMSVGESFQFLLNSRYIRDLATLVIAYGVSINLVEVTWKGKIKAQFPNPNDYSAFMGDFSSCTGAATLVMMLLSRFIFTRFGWGVAAIITPTVLGLTGAVFFGLIIFGEPLQPLLASLNVTPLYLAVIVGAAQNIFSKSSKYSLFDPCKETAYIPLDDEIRTKGKAAIDVICNPLGKSGGALIQQLLIIGFGSLSACAPYLATIVLTVVGAWMIAARSLDKQFTELQKQEMREKLAEAKKEMIKRKEAAKRYHFTSKATEDGFAEGRWVPMDAMKKGSAVDTNPKTAASQPVGTDSTSNGSLSEDNLDRAITSDGNSRANLMNDRGDASTDTETDTESGSQETTTAP